MQASCPSTSYVEQGERYKSLQNYPGITQAKDNYVNSYIIIFRCWHKA